ncbi:NERD domain-containing protein [Candidatus Saccharibacteria bacterium]|nr:NERD domain-containing protein [Candidatus Saccharibacteria bacterium]
MGIIDALFYKYFGPVFIKEDCDVEPYIEKMKSLSARASGKLKEKIDDQIAVVEAGLKGEKQIAFELKNSGMDMLVMHDLYLEKNGLSAQIDFLVIARKHIFVIECKNLYGNIEIDEKGNFIRHKWLGKFERKEGFPSPVSQNERHLNILKEIRREYKNNFVTQGLFDKLFPQTYRSIVVLANPKTILKDQKAPEEIRKVVIRLDQLVSYIKKIEEQDDLYKSSEKEMHELLDSFIKYSKPNKSDYAKKYENMLTELIASKAESPKEKYEDKLSLGIVDVPQRKTEPEKTETSNKVCPKCGKPLVLRTAKKGENAGNQFWGCSGFPKCWYRE